MADKYCKKSSLEAVADEIRVRAGASSSTKYSFPSGFVSAIGNLAIPVQRGSPTKELKTNDATYTIQKGVYMGGSVTVDPIEWSETIEPSSSQQTIKDTTNNKPLKKVVVAPINNYQIAYGYWIPSSSNPTSASISGLSFKPVGVYIVSISSPYGSYSVGAFAFYNNQAFGYALPSKTSNAAYKLAPITSASVSFGSNNVSIQNIYCTDRDTGSQQCHFNGTTSSNTTFRYFVWGQ